MELTELDWRDYLKEHYDVEPLSETPLHGGCIGSVAKLTLPSGSALGSAVVVKTQDTVNNSGSQGLLAREAAMLEYLKVRSPIPIPQVYGVGHGADQSMGQSWLLMEFMEGQSRFNASTQTRAAEQLAQLHRQTNSSYGFATDTWIGGLPQPNTPTDSWLEFFAQHRIGAMADLALAEGQIDTALRRRLQRFQDQVDRWLLEPEQPALLHGDAWTTNMLAHNGELSALLDPALYYGHPEIELAFITLFGAFGEPFFKRYDEISPIPDGFFPIRKDLYNLYPLLVHVRIFGPSYSRDMDRILKRVGC